MPREKYTRCPTVSAAMWKTPYERQPSGRFYRMAMGTGGINRASHRPRDGIATRTGAPDLVPNSREGLVDGGHGHWTYKPEGRFVEDKTATLAGSNPTKDWLMSVMGTARTTAQVILSSRS
jgi:hypothetical protein